MVCVCTDDGSHWKSNSICSCTFYIYLYVFSLTIFYVRLLSTRCEENLIIFLNVDFVFSLNILVKSLSIHVGTNYQSFLILEGGTEPSKEWKYD